VYYSNSDVRIEERPRPSAGPGELLLRVEASGVCGSDVMEWYRIRKAPVVLGHEVAGTVAEVGDGVTDFAVGDRIVTTHHVPCGTCRYCATDRESVCETLRTTTFDPGGFAEFVRIPEVNVRLGTFRLPDHVGFVDASFVEPLACAVRGLRKAGIAAGQRVAVLGAGVSGALMIQLARARGAEAIVATDLDAFRLDQARRSGATATVRADDDVPARIRDHLGGSGADLVVVCTAARPALDQALASVDRGGKILFFAPLAPGETLALPMWDLWRDCVDLIHSYAGPPADMQEALDLIAAGRVDVGALVTHRLGLEETARGFALMVRADASLKVVIEPQR
jgi:L-iditol 2-dehydrogenase